MSFSILSFFKNKLTWLGKLVLFSLSAFTFNTEAGMVWQTLNAPIVDGYISSGNSSRYSALARLVSIDFNDPTPNPCYNAGCIITVGAYHNFSHAYTYAASYTSTPSFRLIWNSNTIKDIQKQRTMGELYSLLSKIGDDFGGKLNVGIEALGTTLGYCDPGFDKTCIIKNKWEAYSKICYALVFTFSTAYYKAFPGQNCIGPTPPNNECKIDAGAVTLDHGSLTTDEVNGNKKKETVRISCTYPANAEVSVVSNTANEKIMLKGDGSLYSTVTVDGVPGITGKKIAIPTGGVPIDLESTLYTVGNIEEGPFSGNGILIINAY
ncbi:PapG chaperone-binding domain-containing protein [Serratia nevei]|uniref:MrpH family fimbial adhesin n=1 Tax=Serratia nevei TaxID=2703794 RepID=UPI001650AA6C|nr:PapG chaperone-binding domain-containing protein [Serratia nevei]